MADEHRGDERAGMRKKIEQALAAWREAEKRLQNATNGDRDALQADVDRHRNDFQSLSGDHMIERMDALHDAESRRQSEMPSTPPYHAAARQEKAIAAEIFESARANDEDTPTKGAN
ncbi:hypothetical protein [Aeromicrobium sp.]